MYKKGGINGGDHTKSNITKRSALGFDRFAALRALVSKPIIWEVQRSTAT
jgi:hypothetical protein